MFCLSWSGSPHSAQYFLVPHIYLPFSNILKQILDYLMNRSHVFIFFLRSVNIFPIFHVKRLHYLNRNRLKESTLIRANAFNPKVLVHSMKNEFLVATTKAQMNFSPISIHHKWSLTQEAVEETRDRSI